MRQVSVKSRHPQLSHVISFQATKTSPRRTNLTHYKVASIRSNKIANQTPPAAMNVYARKSKIALGFCLISLIFLLETSLADHRMPNPASPIVWTLLGITAAACLVYAGWAHGKSKKS
jgi:cytochrome bd-type quinol oxidase subunit 1